jgi:uncharacterized protein YkwD
MLLRPAFLTLLLVAPILGQDDDLPTVQEQVVANMKVVRSRRGTIDDKVPAMEALLELGPTGARALAGHLSRELRGLRKDREEDQAELLRSFQRLAGRLGRERAGQEHAGEIEDLRRTVLQGAVTKASIPSEKDPAVLRLTELLRVRLNDVWDADEDLYEDFGAVLDALDDEDFLFGYWWDAREIVADGPAGERLAARLKDHPDPVGEDEDLLAELDQLARYAMAMTDADRKVMSANAEEFEGLDAKEADGIVELNDLRVLLGLNALRVDLRLCKACRGHSQDMVEGGFFSHSSPVEGKESPWKRAALEGTSAGAENIAAGAAEGPDAIRMWWYSPGHHRNMLGGHRRVGLGRHQGHWTQCFGG